MLVNTTDPKSFHSAIKGPEGDLWQAAGDLEINSHYVKQCTFEIVLCPPGVKVIPSLWVLHTKPDGRKKARIVTRWSGGDDKSIQTFAPTTRWDSLRIELAYANQLSLMLQSTDVETAFLMPLIERPLYMTIPQGYESKFRPLDAPKSSYYV